VNAQDSTERLKEEIAALQARLEEMERREAEKEQKRAEREHRRATRPENRAIVNAAVAFYAARGDNNIMIVRQKKNRGNVELDLDNRGAWVKAWAFISFADVPEFNGQAPESDGDSEAPEGPPTVQQIPRPKGWQSALQLAVLAEGDDDE
jgi:hypothetical protein